LIRALLSKTNQRLFYCKAERRLLQGRPIINRYSIGHQSIGWAIVANTKPAYYFVTQLKFIFMRGFAIFLIILGAGSFVLHSMDREFRLLMWIDNWGAQTGNMIRIGMIVLGVVLLVLSFRKKTSSASTSEGQAD
jgi:hypothetical protein